jgi:hypothetical protein
MRAMESLNDRARRLLTSRMLRVGWLCVALLVGGQALAAAHLHGEDVEALCAVCSVGIGDGIDNAQVCVLPFEPVPAIVDRPVTDTIRSAARFAGSHPRAPPHI